MGDVVDKLENLKARLALWAQSPERAQLAAALVQAVANGEGEVWWIVGWPFWKPYIPLHVTQYDYVTDGNGASIPINKDPV